MISRAKGTQDFIDTRLYRFILQTVHEHLSSAHFVSIETPIIESVELFKRSLGLYTDVVSKEMFLLQAPAGSSEQLCLRPEMTASVARAFIEHAIEQQPWRVFSTGAVFRYERPQKGRFRQFHQITIEVIGAQSISYDVQLITLLDRLFHEKFKLDNYALLINFLGCSADRAAYKEILQQFLRKHQEAICATCQQRMNANTLRIFDCKNERCQTLYQQAPFIADHLCSGCAQEWQTVQEQLSLLSVTYAYKPNLVRGLDYYNKTAFEFVSSNLGAQNAFCAGGRYDGLIHQLNPKQEVPALGGAIGIERLLLLLEAEQQLLNIPQLPAVNVLIPLEQEQVPLALLIADLLHHNNICTELLLDGSLKSRMRKADKLQAQFVLLIGPDEVQSGSVRIKNMQTGTEESIRQTEVAQYIMQK